MKNYSHFLNMENALHANSCLLHLYTTIPGGSMETHQCTHNSDNFAEHLYPQRLEVEFPVVLMMAEAQAKIEV